tara:strand:- start:91 stop:486 length:396 start_codon:yes stop_codon:yes gene_type:complete
MKISLITKKKLKEFGLLFGFGLIILIGFIIPSFSGHTFRTWTLIIGLPSILISFANPNLLFYPYKIWMFLGNILGWLNSRLLLGLVYLIILIPLAMIMKLFGYDPLKKRNYINKGTYKIKRNYIIDLERIF